jgi:hypothetical protein
MVETYVALVGAGGAVLGALAGALAAGVMARKTARVQTEGNHLSQVRDLQEQHRARHREISRTVYSDFIERTGVAWRALRDLSYYEVTDVDVMLAMAETANETLEAVSKTVAVIELEGEKNAASAAEQYRRSLEEILTTAAQMMERAAAATTSIEQLDPARVQRVLDNAALRRQEFIVCARRALGNDSV